MAQPPVNYSAESMLPSPTHAAELKVFQGGGGMPDGAQPQLSLYDQPVKPVEMVVYRGGGPDSKLSADDILKLKFRDKTVNEMLTEEGHFLKPEHLIVFEKKDKTDNKPYEVVLEEIGKILVVPYTISDSGTFSYVRGKYKEGKEVDLAKLFFYADSFDRSEATKEDFLKSEIFVLPYSTLLTPTAKSASSSAAPSSSSEPASLSPGAVADASPFFKVEGDAAIDEKEYTPPDETEPGAEPGSEARAGAGAGADAEAEAEKEDEEILKPKFPHEPLIRLNNGYLVRYVNPKTQTDIEEFRFLPTERLIFEKILHFDNDFIQDYLSKNKEAWITFWKLFIQQERVSQSALNGTSPFFYLSAKQGKEVRDFFTKIQQEYEGFLMRQAREILFKTEAYGIDKVYKIKRERSKKGLDTSFFEKVETGEKEGKERVSEEDASEMKEIEEKWKALQINCKLLFLKKDEYENNYNTLYENYKKIEEEYSDAINEYDRALSIGVSDTVKKDLQKNVNTLRSNLGKILDKTIQASNIYEEAVYLLEKVILIEKELSADTAFKFLQENLKDGPVSALKDLGIYEEILDILEEFSDTIPLLIKEMQSLSKIQAKEEEKNVSEKEPKRKRKPTRTEEEEEDDEEYTEDDIEEKTETLSKARSRTTRETTSTVTPRIIPRKAEGLSEKEREIENILNAVLSNFLLSDEERKAKAAENGLKPPKQNIVLTSRPGTNNTKIMFYFLLLQKLKEYHTSKEIHLQFDFTIEDLNPEGIKGKNKKNYKEFIEYLLKTEPKETLYIKSWKAFALSNLGDSTFNLSEEEHNKMIDILSSSINSIGLSDGEEIIGKDDIENDFIALMYTE